MMNLTIQLRDHDKKKQHHYHDEPHYPTTWSRQEETASLISYDTRKLMYRSYFSGVDLAEYSRPNSC